MRRNVGLTTACCIVVLMWLLASYTDDSLLGGLAVIAGIVIWLGLIPLGIYRVVTRGNLQWKERVVPFYLLLIPLSAGLIISTIKQSLYKSDWLIVKAHDFRGSDEFRLKENYDFEYWRDSPLSSSIIVDGKYSRHDSAIILQPSLVDKLGDLHGFIIRPYVNDDKQLYKTPLRLIPLDREGHKADSMYFYANKKDW